MAKKSKPRKPPKAEKKAPRLDMPGRAPRDERWEVFCLEYVKDFNATNAYCAAFNTANRKVAGVEGCKLLANPRIKSRVQALTAERKARILAEGDEILKEIQKLGFADIRTIIDPDTQTVLPTTEWPDEIAMAVAALEVKELFHPITGIKYGEIKKIKLWDKPKPLEMLGKNKKLFGDEGGNKVNVTVVTADKEQIKAIMKELQDEC